ncbi:unnamed protein product [Danaus chrysippus]|uniref:(African queen) hypothetical protein n=1 Tax=Danaus chrysippus TaxID=151541 RepID=A0A8J2R479_9NEOP|nr:unnamed protein product [Danaus chrysippus]
MPLNKTACFGSDPRNAQLSLLQEGRSKRLCIRNTVTYLQSVICSKFKMHTRLALDRPYLHRKNSLPSTCSNYLTTHNAPDTPYLSITCTTCTRKGVFNLKITNEPYFVHNSHMWSDAQKGYFPQHTELAEGCDF